MFEASRYTTLKQEVCHYQDFGIGIPPAEQKKVFQQFYRIAGTRGQTAPGLGIGLSIAHKIIEHYGGKLWVTSIEGQGSTFSFSLPSSCRRNNHYVLHSR